MWVWLTELVRVVGSFIQNNVICSSQKNKHIQECHYCFDGRTGLYVNQVIMMSSERTKYRLDCFSYTTPRSFGLLLSIHTGYYALVFVAHYPDIFIIYRSYFIYNAHTVSFVFIYNCICYMLIDVILYYNTS